MPSEIRLTPAAAYALNRSCSTVPGLASIEISQSSVSVTVRRTASMSRENPSADMRLGVPPPKKTDDTFRPATARAAHAKSSVSAVT